MPLIAFWRAFFSIIHHLPDSPARKEKNPCFENAEIRSVFCNLEHLGPDGIGAQFGVFREWPDWQTGHFTGFLGFKVSFWIQGSAVLKEAVF